MSATDRRISGPGNAPHRRMARLAGLSLEAYIGRCDQGEKFCNGCKQWKLLDLFHRDASSGDGHRPPCKSCWNVRHATYEKRRRHRSATQRVREAAPILGPRELYRQAKNDPARIARFAAIQAAARAAVERADAMDSFWRECQAKRAGKARTGKSRGPGIVVGVHARSEA